MPSFAPRLVPAALLLVGVTWLAAHRQHAGNPPQEPVSEPADEARTEPNDWWFGQRAYPGGEISPEKVAAARAEALELRDEPGVQADLVWRQEGPFNIGGRVTAIAAKPGSSLVYAGSANGGVWKSLDGGVHWTSISDGVPLTSIGALAIEPGNPDVLFAGGGEANGSVDSYDGEGVHVTRDGGGSWNDLGLRATRRIGAIRVDPIDPARLYVAAMGSQFTTSPDRGFYRSTNGGATWQRTLFVNDSTGVSDIAVNPVHPDTMFASTWERVRHYTYRRAYGPGTGIWRSTDRGGTWTRLSNGLPPAGDNVGRIALAVAPSRPSTVYAQMTTGASGGYRGLGFYRSTDGGTTWARRDAGTTTYTNAFGGFSWYFGAMGVDPVNADRVWALGVTIQRSSDAGTSWSNVTGASHVDQHAIWIDPANTQNVYAGNDGGVFRSGDGGDTWTGTTDLPISQFYAGAVAAYDANKLMGGLQDNNTVLTLGGPDNWFAVLAGDGFVPLMHPTLANKIYAEYQFCSTGTGLWLSEDNGNSFTPPTGFTSSDRYNWSSPAAMNPTDPNELLVGSFRVYRSSDGGLNYAPISPDLTRALASTLTFSTISTVAISPLDPGLYYAGTDDGRVWRTDNRGANWIEITAGLPVRWVTRVTPDPADANVVYVTLSGFGQDERLSHVYRSTNRGGSWSAIAGNLPDAPANDLIVDPSNTARLYLGTDFGVWVSQNTGATWYELGAGLPLQSVFDLDYQAASRRLYAFTHGRSVWSIDLATQPVSAPRPSTPSALTLSAPAPNPSRGEVMCRVVLTHPATLTAEVLDSGGRRVRTLVSAARSAGALTLLWDGRDARSLPVAPGTYYLRARAGNDVRVGRIVRLDSR